MHIIIKRIVKNIIKIDIVKTQKMPSINPRLSFIFLLANKYEIDIKDNTQPAREKDSRRQAINKHKVMKMKFNSLCLKSIDILE